ncbi:preprotein translocase [Caballeronia zhejiangensis]|uniref:Preprotein translocase n=2 Tax=Caballeronia zhejiangensis TaxID=871203 RepID=A0A656QRS1_9BURK|nr:preprotein translocase [Caballeronia zhejiangensis]MCI1041909.1 2OG-Fe(II) oxygenase [Caballeronia zhejiangensis]
MQSFPQFDESWKNWLDENIRRGCSHQSMIDAMVANAFDPNTAHSILSRRIAGEEVDAAAVSSSASYVYGKQMLPQGPVIKANDCRARVLFSSSQPVVALLGDVLTEEECERLIEIGRQSVKQSAVVDPASGAEIIIRERTSQGAFVNGSVDPLVAKIDRRLAELTNIPLENGEDLHLLRYGIGGEYRPHFDYFPEELAGSRHHLQRGGQRIATVILYLNEVELGGETTFPNVGLSVRPQRGSALYFEYGNELGQVDPKTLHAGNPVEQGEKWIATKWIRRSRFQPLPQDA